MRYCVFLIKLICILDFEFCLFLFFLVNEFKKILENFLYIFKTNHQTILILRSRMVVDKYKKTQIKNFHVFIGEQYFSLQDVN